MTKKYTISSLLLLFASVFTNNADLVFYKDKAISPFPFYKTTTSMAWYADMLGDLVSFTLIMWCVVIILAAVYHHFEDFTKPGYYGLYMFTWMWHRVFWVIAVTSMLDIVHFLLAARQWHLFFVLQNGFFLLITAVFIFKALRK